MAAIFVLAAALSLGYTGQRLEEALVNKFGACVPEEVATYALLMPGRGCGHIGSEVERHDMRTLAARAGLVAAREASSSELDHMA